MRYLGLGIEDSHHPWSENTRSFTSRELLDHLVHKVIPHEKTRILPTEAPITAPTLTTFQKVVNVGAVIGASVGKIIVFFMRGYLIYQMIQQFSRIE